MLLRHILAVTSRKPTRVTHPFVYFILSRMSNSCVCDETHGELKDRNLERKAPKSCTRFGFRKAPVHSVDGHGKAECVAGFYVCVGGRASYGWTIAGSWAPHTAHSGDTYCLPSSPFHPEYRVLISGVCVAVVLNLKCRVLIISNRCLSSGDCIYFVPNFIQSPG